jgi:hypothetical protein
MTLPASFSHPCFGNLPVSGRSLLQGLCTLTPLFLVAPRRRLQRRPQVPTPRGVGITPLNLVVFSGAAGDWGRSSLFSSRRLRNRQ